MPLVWRKSTRSGSNGMCVEVAPVWRKASRSTANGSCVEVAPLRPGIAVRDSKDPDGPMLVFTAAEWQAFLASVKGT